MGSGHITIVCVCVCRHACTNVIVFDTHLINALRDITITTIEKYMFSVQLLLYSCITGMCLSNNLDSVLK